MAPSAPYLDLVNQAFVDELATQPSLAEVSISEFRTIFETIQEHKPTPGVTRTAFTVPFEAGVKVVVFRPSDVPKKTVLPVVFYFHGGAWVAGNAKSYDSICSEIALKTGFAVVFPEYTLAPEARFPMQHEQCYAVVKWVSEHGRTKGLRQEGFAIVGDAAGAQLTVATTILCSTRRPIIPIAHQTLTHPFLDTVLTDRPTTSEVKFFDNPLFPVALQRKAVAAYIPNAQDRETEFASPRLHISDKQAKLQPTTLIINSSVDILRDDGLLYGQILQRNGVDCAIFTSHGQVHLSEVIEATRQSETPRVVVRMICEEIRNAIGRKWQGNGQSEQEDGILRDHELKKRVHKVEDTMVVEEEKGVATKRRRTRRS